MDLTGKCLKDFYNHLNKDYKECDFAYDLNINDFSFKTKTEQIALIIDFFDSVGIYFNIGLSFKNSQKFKCAIYIDTHDKTLNDCLEAKCCFESNKRQEALTEAIKTANEIYNNLFLPK